MTSIKVVPVVIDTDIKPRNLPEQTHVNTEVNKDVDGVFKPVSIYLRVSGFYLGHHTNGFFRFLEIVNIVVMRIILILNVARYSTIFLTDNEFGGSLMGSISQFLLYCLVALMSFVMPVPIYMNFLMFIDKLKVYITNYSNSKYLSKVKVKIRIFVACGFIADLAYLIVMSEGIQTVFPSLKRHLTPFQNTTGMTNEFVMILYAILLLAVGMTLAAVLVMFIIITYCLKKEFSSFNDTFKQELLKGEKNFEARFDCLRTRHETLCELTETANEIHCHFAALVYGFGIPIVCCLLYGIIQRSLPIDDAVFNSWNLVTIVFCMGTVTGMGSTLNALAHNPLPYIFRSNWALFSDGTLQKVALFVARLSSEKIGYSIYGLFTIERSTFLMVCGTILTYAMVVLQLEQLS